MLRKNKRRKLLGLLIALLSLAPGGAVLPQQDPPSPSCCVRIFWTALYSGRAFVWAAGRGSAKDILRDLDGAVQYLKLAHESCSAVNPAWPDWRQAIQDLSYYRSTVGVGASNEALRAAAVYLQNVRASYSEKLGYQIILSRFERRTTCDETYFKIGYDLGVAEASLMLVREAQSTGEERVKLASWADRTVEQARQKIMELNSVYVVTGKCVLLEPDTQEGFRAYSPGGGSQMAAAADLRIVRDIIKDCDRALRERCGGGGGGGHRGLTGKWCSVFIARRSSGVTREFDLFPFSLSQDEYTGSRTMTFTFGEASEQGTGTWDYDGALLTITFDQGDAWLAFEPAGNDQWRLNSSGGELRSMLESKLEELKAEGGTVTLILRRC